MLTGESVPVTKQEAALPTPDLPVADQRNMAFLGTAVAGGQGEGVVVATGLQTAVGRIAAKPQADRDAATRRCSCASTGWRKLLALVVLLAATVIAFASGVAPRSTAPARCSSFAVALAVSAMPEGLPVVVTVALAVGMRRMAKRHAVDPPPAGRRNAWQHVGHRLRQDRHADAEPHERRGAATDAGVSERDLLAAAVATNAARLGSDSGDDRGDPMELALLRAGRSARTGASRRSRARLLHDVPFQTERRFSAATCRDAEGKAVTHIKGAPEVVTTMCRNVDEAAAGANAARDGGRRPACSGGGVGEAIRSRR